MKLLSIALLFGLAQIAVSQNPQSGSVQGIIRSSESSQPVADAIVELRAGLSSSDSPRPALSNDNGEFVFSNVAPGTYRVVVTRNGFASRQGPLIQVSPTQTVSVAPMTLFPGASVSGRISYVNGDPMPVVGVSIVKSSYGDDGRPTFTEISTQITNDRGEFRFFWLPPGTYYLRAENARQNMQTTILMNSNGNGVRTATGMFTSVRSLPQTTNDPGLNGNQTYIALYYPGTSDMQRATPLELRPGAELGNVNITMIPETLHQVRGVAMNSSTEQPAQGTVIASMRSIDAANGNPGAFNQYLQFDHGGGAFEFRGVFSGSYEITASAEKLAGRVIADVRGVDANIRVPLRPPVTVTGKLKGEGISDLTRIQVGIPGNMVAVAANGDFTLSNVAIGSYTFAVRFPPTMPDAYVQSIHIQDADITTSPLIIDGGAVPPVDVLVNSAGGSVEGKVTNVRGDLISGATVLLLPDQSGTIRPQLYRSGTSNGSATVEFHALPPGNYFIYAWTDVEKNAWFAPAFLRDFESSRGMVLVGSGQKLQISVTTAPTN
jgi:hypothetical protein